MPIYDKKTDNKITHAQSQNLIDVTFESLKKEIDSYVKNFQIKNKQSF
jgi:hypothetical protein